MNIIICEDDKTQIQLIKSLLNEWCAINGQKCVIDTFFSAEEFLFNLDDISQMDLIILDIEMSEMNGMELAKIIRAKKITTQIAFITGYQEYVFEGYVVDAISYILKPLKKEEFYTCMDKALKNLNEEDKFMIVNTDDGICKIIISHIKYAEVIKHYMTICTKSKTVNARISLKELENQISEFQGRFVKSHRSYIVNIDSIERITKSTIQLTGNIEIPIARGKWEEVNKKYLDYYRNHIGG